MKSFFLVARPKTLVAALVPVWMACILAFLLHGKINLALGVFTLLSALFIQMATNLFNDVIDYDKGADTDKRIGPTRMTHSGKMNRKHVYKLAWACLLFATLFAWPLFLAQGWPIVAIGIPSLYLTYGYTGGFFPLAYKGLGEVFVILFFGVVAVMGSFYVQTGYFTSTSLLLGFSIGCLAAVLISINNLRDIQEDKASGKMTLAVRLGKRCVIVLLFIMTALPYLLLFVIFDAYDNLYFFLPALFLGIFILNYMSKSEPSQRYNKYLALSSLQMILYAVAFSLASLL